MPQPTRSDVHVNRPLTNFSIAYIQKAEDFIADKVFANVPVMKQSDRYFTYDKAYWFKTQAQKRAPSSESAGSGFTVDSSPSYFADVWAVHKDVDDQTRQNADEPLNMDRDATLFVTQQLMLRKEMQFMSKYVAASVWSGHADFTPTLKWDATGDPIADIDLLKGSIKAKTGFEPNTLLLAYDTFLVVKNNAKVLERIKYTQTGIVTQELLSALFGVKVLVAKAVVNSAAEGATASNAFLVSDCALLVYANPTPSILQPSAGYTFSWSGLFGAGAMGTRIMSFRMENIKSDRIEGEMAFDMKLVAADLGCYLYGLDT